MNKMFIENVWCFEQSRNKPKEDLFKQSRNS